MLGCDSVWVKSGEAYTRSQILGSAYLLKGSPAHLENIFEEEASTLAPWQDSPGEVSTHDWRDYLGKRE